MKRFFDTLDERGRLSPHRSEAIRSHLQSMAGKKVVIEIKEGNRRSTRQNAFMFGVIIPIIKQFFEESGYSVTPEDVHAFLKEHVGGMVKVIVLPDGTRKSFVESSAKLTTVKWEEYVEKIRAWAAQWGVDIPEPTPQNIDSHLFHDTDIKQLTNQGMNYGNR